MNVAKKKVFICITKSNWGGAQKYVFDIATNIPKDKFEVSVLLGGNGELKTKLIKAGIRTITLENSQRDVDTKKEFNLLFELIKIFKKEKPDVIHLNSSKIGFVGAIAGRLAGIKNIIYIAHGWAFNEKRSIFSKMFFKIIYIFTILICDKTIAVSEITKKQIGWPWKNKLTVIRNGIKEIDFKDRLSAKEFLIQKIIQTKSDAASMISSSPYWIGTISELHSTKGLEYAIEAISKIKTNVIFVIMGEGENRKKLQELSVKLGCKNRVFLIGQVEQASLYLKALDIFTLTSITEALPYSLLEAGKAALPVIASKVGGIPEIIENNKTGILVSAKHPEEIRSAIENYLQNPNKMATFGRSLKEKINMEFSQEKMFDKTFALYRK